MFEYHGWFTVQAAPCAAATGNADCRAAAGFVRRYFASHGGGARDTGPVRPDRQFHFGGLTSHRGPEFDDLLGALRSAAARAVGSYGFVHYLDDDDDPPRPDGFHMLVVRHGQIVEDGRPVPALNGRPAPTR